MNLKALFPCAFTVGNLICGFLAITYAINSHLTQSAWLIILGAVFDGLDGLVARAIDGDTRFGREFDSFADLISFGVAPMVMLYNTLIAEFGFWAWFICGIFLISGVFRLVRHNILASEEEYDNYPGLPITSSGLLLAGLILFSFSQYGKIITPGMIVILLITLSLLMVSTMTFKKIRFLGMHTPIWIKFLLSIPLALLLIIKPQVMILLVMVIYICLNLVNNINRLILKESVDRN
jgi:CDP-diacylglycerol---serine O-phosphatidyltransferase